MSWNVNRVFGEETSADDAPLDDDHITAVAYDATGDRFAVGDFSGRVVFMKRRPDDLWKYDGETQAHEGRTDVLRNFRIHPAVRTLCWSAWGVISADAREAKLWSQRGDDAKCRRAFTRAHDYKIHSVSAGADGQTVLTCDELRMYAWPLEARPCDAFVLLDSKPDDFGALDEVLTKAEFHPRNPSEVLYATSSGGVKVADLRVGPACSPSATKSYGHARRLRSSSASTFADSVYDGVAGAVTDARYAGATGDGIVTRDFLNLNVWDARYERRPVRTWGVHQHLRKRFKALYESDALFEDFTCSANSTGSVVVTGSFRASFFTADVVDGSIAHTMPRGNKRDKQIARADESDDDTPLGWSRPVTRLAHNPTRDEVFVADTYKLFQMTLDV